MGAGPDELSRHVPPTNTLRCAAKLESLPSHAGQLRKALLPRELVNRRTVFQNLPESERRKSKNTRVNLTALNSNEPKDGVI